MRFRGNDEKDRLKPPASLSGASRERLTPVDFLQKQAGRASLALGAIERRAR
jgi:hypothetical protein